jgi:2-methylfumaryl-CoA hydratase
LRLVGVKSAPLKSIAEASSTVDGKRSYNPNVVLDLDYTVLMPRKS